MRSLVQAVALFTNAFAAAIGEALVPLSNDPLLIWNYAVPAILAVVGGTMFWIQFRHLDAKEDLLNMLPAGHVTAADKMAGDEEEVPHAGTIPMEEEKRV
jgi:POT family proton-dependent oligopeptide transporter